MPKGLRCEQYRKTRAKPDPSIYLGFHRWIRIMAIVFEIYCKLTTHSPLQNTPAYVSDDKPLRTRAMAIEIFNATLDQTDSTWMPFRCREVSLLEIVCRWSNIELTMLNS